MLARHRLLVPILCALAWGACDRTADPDSAATTATSEPADGSADPESAAEHVAEADEATADGSGTQVAADSAVPTPVDQATFEERAEAVDGTRAGQELLAALLVDALERDDAGDVGVALRALGRRLGEYRADRYEVPLVRAVQWFATAEQVDLRRRVDGRFVVPALEVLLDVRDGAAIDRLHASYENSPAAAAFSGARAQSLTFRASAARLEVGELPESCELFVDAAPSGAAPIPFGSHTIRCNGAPPHLFEIHAPVGHVAASADGVTVTVAP